MGQKSRKIFCVVLNCRENFLLSLCDPKFYPSPRAILGSTSLYEAFFPPLEKVGAHVCLQCTQKVPRTGTEEGNCLDCLRAVWIQME